MLACVQSISHLAIVDRDSTYFSVPSGMVALIFEAEADEHPPPPVPARVALLGSILRTEATALSICEGILGKGRAARFRVERIMNRMEEILSPTITYMPNGKMEHEISRSML